MKVSELIEALQQLPQDTEVLSFNPIAGSYCPVEEKNIMFTLEGILL